MENYSLVPSHPGDEAGTTAAVTITTVSIKLTSFHALGDLL